MPWPIYTAKKINVELTAKYSSFTFFYSKIIATYSVFEWIIEEDFTRTTNDYCPTDHRRTHPPTTYHLSTDSEIHCPAIINLR